MAQSFRTNLSNVVLQYIRQLNIPVTAATVQQSLEENPYYPSLYSISNTFSRLNIENVAFTADTENFNELQPPFITYCNGQSTGKDFVLVTKITDTTVNYIAENKTTQKADKEKFLKNWQNIVFAAEANSNSGEKEYNSKLKIQKIESVKRNLLYSGIVLLICLLGYWLISTANNGFAAAGIAIIKLAGVAATILLLVYEIDKTNSIVKSFCSAGKQTSCEAVLNSKAGKFFGMSWGELGFFYFAATTLFLLLPGVSFINKIPWLAISSTLVAPYIVFSIYYQWKVVQQWCPLCLTVQAVLAMELLWAVSNFWITGKVDMVFEPGVILPVVCSVLLVITVWYLLKPVLLAAKAAPGYNAAYKRLLYNPEIFNGLLAQQATAPEGWQQLGINIGNPDAPTTIVKVCNPYCGPCAKAHTHLEEIIHKNPDINVRIIFTTSNNKEDSGNPIVKHLLAIHAQKDSLKTEQALDDWYLADKKDYQLFASKYSLNTNQDSNSLLQESSAFPNLNQFESSIDAMNKWCTESEITFTPTIFINGKRLPEKYTIEQLKYIL
jgi:uncharacterized membrane protein/protein-disulfide isomerase